uniref:hypothetical protein n=1 Tax=Proteus mirabilis TaxID=584 RepID=UPI001953C861
EQGLRNAAAVLDDLAQEAGDELLRQQIPRNRTMVIRRAHVRYAGTDTALVVDFASAAETRAGFEAAHKGRFGFIDAAKALV